MIRSDNVFLLTLIDFLLQIIFFAVFIYALHVASIPDQKEREEAVRRLIAHFGASDIVVLTDELTRLVPAEVLKSTVNEFKSTADKEKLKELGAFLAKHGSLSEVESKQEKLKELDALLAKHGSFSEVASKLEKLRKQEEGSGKPPCNSDIKNGKKVARPLARVVATEEKITFDGTTPDLEQVLMMLGFSFGEVRSLALQDFERKFSRLRTIRSDCRYSLTFIETTRYVEPRDAVSRTFNIWPPIKKSGDGVR